jgi:hypothetical protein
MTPQNATYIKWGIGLAVAGTVAFLFFNTDTGGSTNDPTGNTGNTGTLPSFSANKVRLQLFEAMNQSGTDEDGIINILKHITPAQFTQVVTAFGLERYTDILGYKTSFGTPRDLPYWLKSELSTSEYNNLRNKYPNSLY